MTAQRSFWPDEHGKGMKRFTAGRAAPVLARRITLSPVGAETPEAFVRGGLGRLRHLGATTMQPGR